MNGGRAMIYIIIFPVFWIATLVTVGILAYRNRKKWFNKKMRISTIVFLILCTPLSIWGFSALTRPEIQLSGTGYNPTNGITIKTETWIYNSGQTAVRKFWKLDKVNSTNSEESEYKKDSIWVYFDKKGDTLKVEKYKNDKLIETTELKK
ncbi:hypothetical protein [Psychroflexus salarius]|uniref:hypothetical protein n=1 Tax=Psychroflexus salarius TaxID=1155689 RepID=UPI001160F6D5|nr:hypothetical protein [Psychroflexus salarius]